MVSPHFAWKVGYPIDGLLKHAVQEQDSFIKKLASILSMSAVNGTISISCWRLESRGSVGAGFAEMQTAGDELGFSVQWNQKWYRNLWTGSQWFRDSGSSLLESFRTHLGCQCRRRLFSLWTRTHTAPTQVLSLSRLVRDLAGSML